MKNNIEKKLVEILDDCFPKLNEDDVTKPSSNNRSAALVMHAKTVILLRKIRQEAIQECLDCAPKKRKVYQSPEWGKDEGWNEAIKFYQQNIKNKLNKE